MKNDNILIQVPAKPEYFLVIRLSTSAIATRAGFDVDQIEDIKVAVAEAAVILINQHQKPDNLHLTFEFEEKNYIKIIISTIYSFPYSAPTRIDGQNELSFFIIKSLMDKVDIDNKCTESPKIFMLKKYGGTSTNE